MAPWMGSGGVGRAAKHKAQPCRLGQPADRAATEGGADDARKERRGRNGREKLRPWALTSAGTDEGRVVGALCFTVGCSIDRETPSSFTFQAGPDDPCPERPAAGSNFPLMYHMEGGQRKGRRQNLSREEEQKKKRSIRE